MSNTNMSNTPRAKRNYSGVPVWEVRRGHGKDAESIQVVGKVDGEAVQTVICHMLKEAFEAVWDWTQDSYELAKVAAEESVTLRRVGTV